MADPAGTSPWAAALLDALAAGCPVAPGGEGGSNPGDLAAAKADPGFARAVAQVAPIAPDHAMREGQDEAEADPDEAAEREAIQAEPLLPPEGTAEARAAAEAQRRMVAGLLGGSRIPAAVNRPRLRRQATG